MKTALRAACLSAAGGLIAATALAPMCAHALERIIVTASAIGPSAQEIVQRAVANDELRHQHRLALECDQVITTQRLDDSGGQIKHKTAHIVHRETPQFSYSTDAQLSGAKQDGDTVKAEHRVAVMDLRKLAPRFNYSLAADVPVHGRACYAVDYSPKEGQPSSTREEKVINRLHGRFLIDKQTYEILQGEGSLAAPIGVALFTSVNRLDFAFHTQTLPGGEAGPGDFSIDLVVKGPFYFYHQQQTSRLENWRPAG